MFDPRTVPVLRSDAHMRAVAPEWLTPDALRRRFESPPAWEPELRMEPPFTTNSPRPAAVLVPVVERDRPTVLLTQRASHLNSHSGQIAFPGGKVDDTDADAVAAALRETYEEVGLRPEYFEVLGVLPHYTTGSAYVVTPVVALVREGFTLTPNPHEVADAFEVPLEFLMNPAHHRHHMREVDGVRREWLSMPYQDAKGERFIWGATAGMLRNLYRFLSA